MTGRPRKPLPDWEQVLTAAAHLQRILPGTVLVGGTAASVYAGHRRSADADHTMDDLKGHFDDVLHTLEQVSGWRTARTKRPVLILGSLDGIETGVRQLIRSTPLKTVDVPTQGGSITLPTRAEILRIKGALILKRNASRDYIDFIALADHLGKRRTAASMLKMDDLYPQTNGESALRQLIVQVATPRPFDREETDLTTYKGISERYDSWHKLEGLGSQIANAMFDAVAAKRRKAGKDAGSEVPGP